MEAMVAARAGAAAVSAGDRVRRYDIIWPEQRDLCPADGPYSTSITCPHSAPQSTSRGDSQCTREVSRNRWQKATPKSAAGWSTR